MAGPRLLFGDILNKFLIDFILGFFFLVAFILINTVFYFIEVFKFMDIFKFLNLLRWTENITVSGFA